jgi:hypothetical protein
MGPPVSRSGYRDVAATKPVRTSRRRLVVRSGWARLLDNGDHDCVEAGRVLGGAVIADSVMARPQHHHRDDGSDSDRDQNGSDDADRAPRRRSRGRRRVIAVEVTLHVPFEPVVHRVTRGPIRYHDSLRVRRVLSARICLAVVPARAW